MGQDSQPVRRWGPTKPSPLFARRCWSRRSRGLSVPGTQQPAGRARRGAGRGVGRSSQELRPPSPINPAHRSAPSHPATHRIRFPHSGGEIERREPRGRGRPQGRGSGFFPRVPGSQGTERQPSRRPPSPRHKPASSDPKPSDFRLQPANQRRPRPAPAPEARPAPDAPFRPRRGVGGACEGLSGPGDFKGFSVEAP